MAACAYSVTLGARSVATDETVRLAKGQPRHPTLDDDLVIYAGATTHRRVKLRSEFRPAIHILSQSTFLFMNLVEVEALLPTALRNAKLDGFETSQW